MLCLYCARKLVSLGRDKHLERDSIYSICKEVSKDLEEREFGRFESYAANRKVRKQRHANKRNSPISLNPTCKLEIAKLEHIF